MTVLNANPFSYTAGTSALHRTDVRFKLIFLLILSPSLVQASMTSSILFGMFLFWGCIQTGFPVMRVFSAVPFLSVMLIFILTARSITGTGEFDGFGTSFSAGGFREGVLICTKLLTIIIAGGLFTFTTRISEIKAGVEWFLRPLPFISGRKIAVMIGLMVRFIPVIIDTAEDIRNAQEARSAGASKNVLLRMKLLVPPLMRKLILEADKLSAAMESRGYSGWGTPPEFTAARVSWAVFAAVLIVLALLWTV